MSRSTYRALPVAALALLSFAPAAYAAQLSAINAFTGDLSETWEAASTGNHSGAISFFGGMATLTTANHDLYIYGVNGFGLGTSGAAQVANGAKGAGLNSSSDTATLVFSSPISTFGGYWGAATGYGMPDPATVTLSFYDVNNALIGTQAFNYSHSSAQNGGLDWHGYSSTVGIAKITYSGNYVVEDGFQANLAPNAVPEPSALAFLTTSGLSGAGLLFKKRRRE